MHYRNGCRKGLLLRVGSHRKCRRMRRVCYSEPIVGAAEVEESQAQAPPAAAGSAPVAAVAVAARVAARVVAAAIAAVGTPSDS